MVERKTTAKKPVTKTRTIIKETSKIVRINDGLKYEYKDLQDVVNKTGLDRNVIKNALDTNRTTYGSSWVLVKGQ